MLVIERTEGILSCVQGNSKVMKLGLDMHCESQQSACSGIIFAIGVELRLNCLFKL